MTIEVEQLSKRYGDVLAVDGIDFTVPPGATFGLLGGNGAGKTTTIAMLLGLLVPTAGRIAVLGHDMASDRFAALARMNFSSPYVSLPHRLTVRENMRVYGHLYNVRDIDGRIAALAEELDLGAVIDRPAGQLSAGQKTRVALAKALINRPGSAAAGRADRQPGPRHRRPGARLAGALPRRKRGCTILLASHNMAEVERLCSDVLMLKKGRVVDRGSPDELLTRYGREDLEEVFLDIARDRRQAVRSVMNAGPLTAVIWGLMYPPSGAVPPVLAAAAGAGLLADPADVHLGFHRQLPGQPHGHQRRLHGRRSAAGRRAAVGGDAAQPDGHVDLLPGGDVVAQPRPCLRQPAAADGR